MCLLKTIILKTKSAWKNTFIIHVVQKIKYHTYTITKANDNINMNGTIAVSMNACN